MTSFSDVINDYNSRRKQNKANGLGISTNMLNLKVNTYSTNFNKIVKEVNTKEQLDKILRNELITKDKSSFYTYSIIMGLYFGIYNLYCYIPLSRPLVNKILKTSPNREDTLIFFENYHNEIVNLLNSKYNLTEAETNNIVNKMFHIIEDSSLYNNEIVSDIAKILIGSNLLFSKEEINRNSPKVKFSITSGKAIECFDKINNQEKEYPSIIPKK